MRPGFVAVVLYNGGRLSSYSSAKLSGLLLDADYLIDLHSSANQGLDYLYYFCDRATSAEFFGLDFAILLDQYDGDAFDEAFIKPWLSLEAIFAGLGRTLRFDIEAWTLELGTGMQLNPNSVAKGLRGIKNYLAQKSVLLGDNAAGNTLPPTMTFTQRSQIKKYYATAGGMIQSRIGPGTSVQRGDKLYQILSFNKKGQLPTVIDVCAETAGLVYDISINQAVSQGEYVLAMYE
ncbi:MAG: succinylglutamate desuccinylase/aspartoacylase family protein [Cyanothece sp. SIO1E1]|nr:succinylglutamate desuccinylase/aspartoacylase family protein [Cyanothece sp. SIO1E1]